MFRLVQTSCGAYKGGSSLKTYPSETRKSHAVSNQMKMRSCRPANRVFRHDWRTSLAGLLLGARNGSCSSVRWLGPDTTDIEVCQAGVQQKSSNCTHEDPEQQARTKGGNREAQGEHGQKTQPMQPGRREPGRRETKGSQRVRELGSGFQLALPLGSMSINST